MGDHKAAAESISSRYLVADNFFAVALESACSELLRPVGMCALIWKPASEISTEVNMEAMKVAIFVKDICGSVQF